MLNTPDIPAVGASGASWTVPICACRRVIHGHRFIQEQEPFMLVLEVLAVMCCEAAG